VAGKGPKLGTYVPRRVAKLSRAISRLQRRNAPAGSEEGGGRRDGERNKKTSFRGKGTTERQGEERRGGGGGAGHAEAEAERKAVERRTRNAERERQGGGGGARERWMEKWRDGVYP